MSSAPLAPPLPPLPATPGAKRRGIPPLPLLTVINFFNYVDRQVVYGMTPHIGEAFHLSNSKLGLLAWANLFVFARRLAGLRADRRPRRPAQGDLHGHHGLVDRHHRLGAVDLVPDAAVLPGAGRGGRRGLRAVGQHAALRGRAARKARARARHLQRRHGARRDERPRAGGDAGAPPRLARRLLDRRRSVDPARALLGVRLRPRAPGAAAGAARARSYLLSPTYLLALAGGILATFGASSLIFWIRTLVIEERHFSVTRRQRLHGGRRASSPGWAASSWAATRATPSTDARAAATRSPSGSRC